MPLAPVMRKQLDGMPRRWRELSALPERTPAEIEVKKHRYVEFTESAEAEQLNLIAALPIAQFYQPKTAENENRVITDEEFRDYWTGRNHPTGRGPGAAWPLARKKNFFHWFLEFPDIVKGGGFDCILGNPPYLGGQDLSGTYGHPFCHYVKWEYTPAGLSDLVVYFVRRIYGLLRPSGFTAFITTNSIKDGDIRKDGLEQVLRRDGVINFAVRGIKWPGRANLVVSLVAIHKGEWQGKRVLDGKEVSVISAFFEDSLDAGEQKPLLENADRVFQGSIFLGDGFMLSPKQADQIAAADASSAQVIFPVTNGDEINNEPRQEALRRIIYFEDWSETKAAQYPGAFNHVVQFVKPDRIIHKEQPLRKRWWLFKRPTTEIYRRIRSLQRCFVAARTTKHLNFSAVPTNYVFTDALYVFTTDRWDLYAVAQSTLHEGWARKYSGALETRLRYSPSDCFNTFPFPEGQWQTPNPQLAAIGEHYHEYRRALMLQLWLGLTDLYNLFHARDLTPALVAKVSKKPVSEAEVGYQGILELRRLHRELDVSVRDAYRWNNLDLGHDFY
jgi:hypothetical protein